MGAPDSGMKAGEQRAADSLLTSFRTIKADERARHEQVLDYWLSIRGNKEFPPLHDLDPLEISDAGPSSILLELIGGGQDAEVRHLGDDLKAEIAVDRIIDAPIPSILACIAKKLPIVAISREFLAFEDSYDTEGGWTRCWVTLLPLSSCGSWVDYVYAFVSVEKSGGKAVEAPKTEAPEIAVEELEPVAVAAEQPEAVAAECVEPAGTEAAAEEAEIPEQVVEEAAAEEELVEEMIEPSPEPEATEFVAEAPLEAEPVEVEETPEQEDPVQLFEEELDPEPASRAKSAPGFAKLIEGFANLTGFYGQSVNIDPTMPVDDAADELPVEESDIVQYAAVEAETAELEVTQPEAESDAPEAEALELDEPVAESPAEETADDIVEDEPVAESTSDAAVEDLVSKPDAVETLPVMEGTLQSKLTEVQAKADEAREAQLRATQALHQGLSAAYDFALDAESSPEEYLRLVEEQGMKIQLRAPMAPVAKLAFDGVCDAATIRQFEAVLAWALKVELPRGTLLERIDQAGGIPNLLSEFSKAA